jgi:hypothetical protein
MAEAIKLKGPSPSEAGFLQCPSFLPEPADFYAILAEI